MLLNNLSILKKIYLIPLFYLEYYLFKNILFLSLQSNLIFMTKNICRIKVMNIIYNNKINSYNSDLYRRTEVK